MNYIERLDKEKLAQIMEQNISYLDCVAEQMKQGYVSVFTGAGLSIESGYVDWKRLLEPIRKQMRLDANMDLTELAQYYKNQYGRQGLNDVVFNEFAKMPKSNDNVSWLAKLPIKEFWTTNYDDVLERTIEKQGRLVETIINQESFKYHDPQRDAVVYKMHGDKKYPDDVVLTREDYQRYDESRQLFTKLLSVELVSRTFLFIGFSFNDPNLERILSIAKNSLNSRTMPRHYCFMRKVQITDYDANQENQVKDVFEKYLQDKNYQELRIKDMANYGIYTILIDDFKQITLMLEYLYNKHIADNVFVSGGIDPEIENGYGTFDQERRDEKGLSYAERFLTDLGKALIDEGFRVYTAFGVGVGNYILSGVLKSPKNDLHNSNLTNSKIHISSLIDKDDKDGIRKELINKCNSIIFLFGHANEGQDGYKSGIWQEYEIAQKSDKFLVPIRQTGLSAEKIYSELKRDGKLPEILAFLEEDCDRKDLVSEIINALKEYREEREKKLKEKLFADITRHETGVFISYRYDADNDIAKKIVEKINNDKSNSYIVKVESKKIKKEKKIKHWIDKTMKTTRITVLLLSKETLESKYVSYELEKSLSGGKLLLPIMIDRGGKGFSEDEEKAILCKLKGRISGQDIEVKKWYEGEGEKNIINWLNEML